MLTWPLKAYTAPGSPLGSLQRTTRTRGLVRPLNLKRQQYHCVLTGESLRGRLLSTSAIPAHHIDMFTVHDIRHAPTNLSWESFMACFFRSGVRSVGWGEL